MKQAVFGSILMIFFLLAFVHAQSQDIASKEVVTSTAKNKHAPRFINNIDLVPQGSATTQSNVVEDATPEKPADTYAGTSSYVIEKCTPVQFKYAILTDRNVEELADTTLYNFIDGWIGTRYSYGGKDKEGIDCSSFAATLMQEIFKVQLPRSSREQYDICAKLKREDLKEGDLVFFNTRGGVSHVGVYLGNNYFVHSSTSSGVMISNLDEDYYRERFISGGRP